tara:strand:+ start:27600 stop:28631 length:1032 start_codon:yes stop_codon:yes gene_type:complete
VSNTIADLINRTYREYLEPVDSVESYSYITNTDSLSSGTGLTSSGTTVKYDGNLFSVEEEDALDAGAIIEIGQELMYSTALNTTANEITVKRGQRGTTAAEHANGSLIKIAPAFPRKNIYDAVIDQVKNLYPTLFAVETIDVTSGTGYRILGNYGSDQDSYNYLVTPIKAISQYTDWSAGSDQTGLTYKPVGIELIDLPNPFTWTDDTSTERTKTYTTGPDVVHALQFAGIASGHTTYVTFKKKFVIPTSEATTLTAVGLETEYEPIIMAGVAAQLLAGKDINMVDTPYITEQLEAAVYPVGSSSSIRNSLLQYQQVLISQARSNLRSKYPEAVLLQGVSYPS